MGAAAGEAKAESSFARCCLQLVEEAVEGRDLEGETLPLTGGEDDVLGLAGDEGVALDDLPVVEHALGEGLAGGGRAEIGGEAEGLHDGQVGLDVVERGAGTLLLRDDVAATPVEGGVDAAHGRLGALDLDEVHGLHEAGRGGELASVDDAAGSGDDLTTTAVDGVGVEGDVVDVVLDRAHVLLAEHTLLGGPLEGGDERVLDLVKVLDTHVDEGVGAGGLGAEAPDLTGLSDVPAVLLGELAGAGLGVVAGGDLAVLDGLRQAVSEGLGGEVETVVLVGRLGQTGLVGLVGDGLAERHDGVGGLELDSGELPGDP
jgi:hypothetical protein